jgi:hypothetical protein
MCQQQTHAVQQTVPLFDHPVGAGEEGFGDGQPERLGGLEIDHQLELARLLDGNVGDFCPAQQCAACRGMISRQTWMMFGP